MRDHRTDDDLCYYCGDPAAEVEHVIPRAVFQRVRTLIANDVLDMDFWQELGIYSSRYRTVRACIECNRLAGAHFDKTASERKARIKAALRRKYRRLLSMPDWTRQELDELDGPLRSYVFEHIIRRDHILERLRY